MAKRLRAIEKRRRAAAMRDYRSRRKHGRMVLPRFHVADVDLPLRLVERGLLSADKADDRDAIREVTIRFLDDIAAGRILVGHVVEDKR